jgi:hypothetical protein
MADKSPRHTTIKKPSKTIKQKRAAKKLKVEQAARRDVVAAVLATGELTNLAAPPTPAATRRPVRSAPGRP